jgi:hypothetical protein
MRMIKWSGVGLALLLVAGCASTGYNSAAGGGLFYQGTVEPVSTTGEMLQQGFGVGVACAHNILGAVAYGDASLDEAKRRADIRDVVTVDRTYERVLGFYGRSCTIVRGH